jgi:hypothetical protein
LVSQNIDHELIGVGVPKGVQTDEGDVLEPNGLIGDLLEDNQHVWVLLKGMIECNSN